MSVRAWADGRDDVAQLPPGAVAFVLKDHIELGLHQLLVAHELEQMAKTLVLPTPKLPEM